MSLIVSSDGQLDALKSFCTGLELRLFANDHHPGTRDIRSSYREVSGSGYQPILLLDSRWEFIPGDPAWARFQQQKFLFRSYFGSIYGYFVTSAESGKLQFAERFEDGPYKIEMDGDFILIRPRIVTVSE